MSDIIDLYLEGLFDYKEQDIKTYVNVACGIIVKRIDDIPHILLIQRAADDHWPLFYEPPRGKCDKTPTEKLKPCLKREVKEEVGLDVLPIKIIDSFSYYVSKEKRKSTQYNFLCVLKDQNQPVVLSKEHQDYKWIKSLGEVELLCLPEMRTTISKVLTSDQSLVNYDLGYDEEKIIEEK